MKFKNRKEAAEKLIEAIKEKALNFDVVLALPRGGVVLGVELAKAFGKPLDLVIPRKIGAPGNDEYAIGAVTEDGDAVWNEEEKASAEQDWLEKAVSEQRTEAKRRREKYLPGGARVELDGKTALIVDDGVATGLTMKAAINAVLKRKPAKIIVAIPVGPPDTAEELRSITDELVILDTPAFFGAIGSFYEVFDQVSDEEVVEMMLSIK